MKTLGRFIEQTLLPNEIPDLDLEIRVVEIKAESRRLRRAEEWWGRYMGKLLVPDLPGAANLDAPKRRRYWKKVKFTDGS